MSSNPEKQLNIDDCWNRIGVWRSGEERCSKLDTVIHCYNCNVYSEAGRSLLDRAIPSGYRSEWAGILAEEKSAHAAEFVSVIVFRLGAEWLALPVNLVNEITLLRDIYQLPHNTNRNIKGMVNIRGELVICMSLGNLLGVEKPEQVLVDEERSINRLIMIREGSGHVVFPVSEVTGIAHYSPGQLIDAPDTVRNSKLNFITGVVTINDRAVGCIDEASLVEEITGNLR